MYDEQITYRDLYEDLQARSAEELAMAVQVVYLEGVHIGKRLSYEWTEDHLLLLVLDCEPPGKKHGSEMTFEVLRRELRTLCNWQLSNSVVIGVRDAFVEVLTIYHEFDLAKDLSQTLMLVCTPPDEYFEFQAA